MLFRRIVTVIRKVIKPLSKEEERDLEHCRILREGTIPIKPVEPVINAKDLYSKERLCLDGNGLMFCGLSS